MVYTAEQKAEALTLYAEVGASEASRRLNMPPRTIRYWANQAHLATARTQNLEAASAMLEAEHKAMREEVRVRLLETALDAFDRMDQEHIDYRGKNADRVVWDTAPSGAFKDYMTAAAIAIDKYRLEMGEATNRGETIGNSLIDNEVRRLVDEMARRSQS